MGSLNDDGLSIIIPTYNERENIVALLGEIHKHLDMSGNEVLVVDDSSPDGTSDLAQEYAKTHSSVRVISRVGERGLSLSVIDGFRTARGKYLCVMDGDLSHDPALLPKLLAIARVGAGIVIGSRKVPGGGADHWPMHRRFISGVATALARLWIHASVRDPMSGYFVVRRDVIDSVLPYLNPKGYKILLEIVARSQERDCRELPFIFKDRTQGHSKLTGRVSKQYLQMLWELRAFSRPLHWLRSTYHYGRYAKVKRLIGAGRTLDIGCGRPCETMDDQAFLRDLNRSDSVGIDIKPSLGPYEFKMGDIRELPFPDGTFENVTAMEVVEHVSEVEKALQEVARVLKPGGCALFTTPDCHPIWNKFWDFWSHSIGQMWHDAHHAAIRRADWEKVMAKFFLVEKVETHWLFDLVFLCRKK